jgi:hypothetical protein
VLAIDRYIHSDRLLPQNVRTIEEVSAIVRNSHYDRSLPQNAQSLSKQFRRSIAICTVIDRFHRMLSTI